MRRFSRADHQALAAWGLDCAEHVLALFEATGAGDARPSRAIAVGRDWVRTGAFAMPVIRAASLGAHQAARGVDDPAAQAAAHAAGQAVAAAHVAQHAWGGALYALKAVQASGGDSEAAVGAELDWQAERLPVAFRDATMARLVVSRRGGRLHLSLDKRGDW